MALDQGSGELGSLGFMAPEQASSPKSPSVRWDVYGLGATTYTLLTGQIARLKKTECAELSAISDTQTKLTRYTAAIKNSTLAPIRSFQPKINSDFATLVERCLHPDPELRTPSLGVLVEDLNRISNKEPLLCRKPWSLNYRVACFIRRHSLASVAAILLTCGLVAVGTTQYRAELQLRSQLAAQQRERSRSLTENGFGQSGLLWSAESLAGAPNNMGTRLQICKFSPRLEHMLDSSFVPDTVSFSDDGSQFTASSDSGLRSWNQEAQVEFQIENHAVSSIGADKPYVRPLARTWWNKSGQLDVVLKNKIIRAGLERETPDNQLLASELGTFVFTQNDQARVCGPQGERLLEDTQDLRVATLAPDTSWVIGQDGKGLHFWDTATGKIRWSAPTEQPISHLSAHPDGSQVSAATQDNTIRIFSTADGALLATLPTGHWAIYFTAFEPNGNKLFACDASGRVRSWESDTFAETSLNVRHQWLAYGIEFDSSGERFITYSVDGTARVWSSDRGEPLTPYLEHQSPVRCASFDRSGERLITGSLDGRIRVFRLVHQSQQILDSSELAVTAAKFVPETQQSVVALGTIALEGTLSGRQPGKGRKRGLLRLYDSLGESVRWEQSFSSPVTTITLSTDGENLFAGFQDGTILCLKTQDGRTVFEDREQIVRVTSIAINRLGDRLAVAFEDGTAKLYEVQKDTLKQLAPIKHKGEVRTTQTTHPTHLEFNSQGTILLTALGDEEVSLWNAVDGSHKQKIHAPAPVRRAVFSPSGTSLAVAPDNGQGSVWSIEGEQLLGPLQHAIAIWDVTFSPNGKHLATASGDSTCRIWNLNSGLLASPPLEHGAPVVRAEYSPDGRWLLTGAKDGVARLWDAQTGELVSNALKSDSPIFALDFQHQSKQLLAGSGDGRLRWSELEVWANRSASWLQSHTQRKTGLRLTILPNGESAVESLTPEQWNTL